MNIAADQLKSFIERIERLEEEKSGIASDIKDIYAEAKGTGFNPKIIRNLILVRKKGYQQYKEEQSIIEIYMESLGILADTPLGQAAILRVA